MSEHNTVKPLLTRRGQTTPQMGHRRVGNFFQNGGVRACKGFWVFKTGDLSRNRSFLTEYWRSWLLFSAEWRLFSDYLLQELYFDV